MKRLIVCCDGTWNNPDQEDNGIPAPTNVMKLYNALLDKDPDTGVVQRRFYQPGVGGEGGLFEKVSGGAVGAGISRNICSAYHWLASHYKEGDEILPVRFQSRRLHGAQPGRLSRARFAGPRWSAPAGSLAAGQCGLQRGLSGHDRSSLQETAGPESGQGLRVGS